MNYMTKDLPKNSKVSSRQLNTVSIVRATIMDRTYKNNKMMCSFFVLVDIWHIVLLFVIELEFVCQNHSFVILTCFLHLCNVQLIISLITFFSLR